MNEVIQCLMNHRSIRKFKERCVEPKIIEEVLMAGIRTATGGNLQAYSIIVVDDKQKLAKLGVPKVPMAIVILADNFRLKRWFEINDAKGAIINKANNLFMAMWDAQIALQSMVIAAESLGLGAYYYGDVLTFDVEDIFNAPELTFPAGMICLGYADNEPKLSDRLPMEAVVHYNNYKIANDDKIKEWYNEKEGFFQNRNSKERLEALKSKGIYNLAQAYKNAKFTEADQVWKSEAILKNIEKAKYI